MHIFLHKWNVVAYFSTYMSYFGTSSLDVSEKVDLVFSVSKINPPEKSNGTPLTSHSSLSRYNNSMSLCLFRCRVQLGTFRELLYLVMWSSVFISPSHLYPQLFSQPLSVTWYAIYFFKLLQCDVPLDVFLFWIKYEFCTLLFAVHVFFLITAFRIFSVFNCIFTKYIYIYVCIFWSFYCI
jgi:hypothetical protein